MCKDNVVSENEISFLTSSNQTFKKNDLNSKFEVPLPYFFRPVDNVDHRYVTMKRFFTGNQFQLLDVSVSFKLTVCIEALISPIRVDANVNFKGTFSSLNELAIELQFAIQKAILDKYVNFESYKIYPADFTIAHTNKRLHFVLRRRVATADEVVYPDPNPIAIEISSITGKNTLDFLKAIGIPKVISPTGVESYYVSNNEQVIKGAKDGETNKDVYAQNSTVATVFILDASSLFTKRHFYLQLNDELNCNEKIGQNSFRYFYHFSPPTANDVSPTSNYEIDDNNNTMPIRLKIPNSLDLSHLKVRIVDENESEADFINIDWGFDLSVEKVYENFNKTDFDMLPLVNKRARFF